MDLKEVFKNEFDATIEEISKNYVFKKGQEREILGTIIVKYLHEVKLDVEKLCFMEFYKKYLNGTMYLDCTDFTVSQIRDIIKESTLTTRDKKLAELYWVDMKSEDDIACELDIDRKTVRNNTPKISQVLKKTAAKIYSK